MFVMTATGRPYQLLWSHVAKGFLPMPSARFPVSHQPFFIQEVP